MAATHRAASSLKVVKTSSIHHFSFLPALGLAQIFKSKQFLSVALVYDLSMSATALYRRAGHKIEI
ncbi:MAG: hypothetical protein J6W51_07510 [Fibrobacter sp.]|nr:hypothetical protein [Fibrobacter sp.]